MRQISDRCGGFFLSLAVIKLQKKLRSVVIHASLPFLHAWVSLGIRPEWSEAQQ